MIPAIWVPGVAGLVTAVLGIPVAHWLEATSYRKPDEAEVPYPGNRWWVPLVLGLACAAVVYRVWFTNDPTAPGWPSATVLTGTLLVVCLSGVCLAAMDMDVHRLPDRIMWPTMGILVAGVSLAALLGGGVQPWGRALLAGLAGGAVFLALSLLTLARGSLALGLGDVKLAMVLACGLGWFGWSGAIVGLFLGFLIGGLTALYLVIVRRASRDSEFAFGPAMMVGALIALVLTPGWDLWTL